MACGRERIQRCDGAAIRRHPRPDPDTGTADRRLADRWLYAVSSGVDRQRGRLCAELRGGLCRGARGRSPGAKIRRGVQLFQRVAADRLLVPGASFLVLLGLYGLYLMWTVMPVLMRTPKNRALPYVIAIAFCAIALE